MNHMTTTTRSLSLAIALALGLAGCGKKEMDVNVRSVRMPAPVINVPNAPAPNVNVAAPAVTVTPTITAAVQLPSGTFVCPSPSTPGDCDGDGILDPSDQCFNVQQGANADPARPGCPLTLIDAGMGDASADAANPTDASADVVDAAVDAADDAQDAAVTADAATNAPEAAVVDAPVAVQPPTLPPTVGVQTVPPPVTSLPGYELGPAIQARVNLTVARAFCGITAVQVRDGQRAAPDAPCAQGEMGCWRRVSSEQVKTCAQSHDAPGCIRGDGTAWGCSGNATQPNAWVFRCGAGVPVCTVDGLATAAGVTPTR